MRGSWWDGENSLIIRMIRLRAGHGSGKPASVDGERWGLVSADRPHRHLILWLVVARVLVVLSRTSGHVDRGYGRRLGFVYTRVESRATREPHARPGATGTPVLADWRARARAVADADLLGKRASGSAPRIAVPRQDEFGVELGQAF